MTAESEALFARAVARIPGGVNSPVRAFRAVGGTPRFVAEGRGARIRDVDGREYVDLCMSWGALPLGHAHPDVVAAVCRAAALGTSFGAATAGEVELAETIAAAMPAVEMVRLTSSGTEATMAALRLARAFTGRDRVLKFAGGYHGHADPFLVEAGSGAATLGVPSSPGVPRAVAADTVVCPYNDLAAVEEAVRRLGTTLAAIVVEPVAANMGLVPPEPGFLEGLRRLADACGALLVFDEVITGFRVGWGGAQGLYGVRPDLTCLGKVVGGGLPVGAYGGRADVMRLVAPEGPVYQAGTLAGNPLAVAAGLATLRALRRRGAYADLAARGEGLARVLREAAAEAGVACHVAQLGSMLTVFFREGAPRDLAGAQAADRQAYARFFHAMLRRGVYLPPSPLECAFVSLAHGPEEMALVAEAAREAFREVLAGVG
jgi:glutamate-1-semialdehyde 2,1-aminomutase